MNSFPPSLSVALICGGPSMERGISLNSARSLLDHLQGEGVRVCPFYVDVEKNFYRLEVAHLYSNTPADFDFKLPQVSAPLEGEALIAALKECDIAFPIIHGAYGEDGTLQAFLESHTIPYVGPDAKTCRSFFHKEKLAHALKKKGFYTLPNICIKKGQDAPAALSLKLKEFFAHHTSSKAVVKPAIGGSSLGVKIVRNVVDAEEHIRALFANGCTEDILIEPYCEGREFTVCILQNHEGQPVPLMPSEIDLQKEGDAFFDFRRKYLPTAKTVWHCPPRFSNEEIQQIRTQAAEIFSVLGSRDFARIDGWLLENGEILFPDYNPISGMEQNSFLFQQGTAVGLSHGGLMSYILENALRRSGKKLPKYQFTKEESALPVWVLCGGDSAERQVSLMSGTNAWLKLNTFIDIHAHLFFLDRQERVWDLPYHYALSHTVEEIEQNVQNAAARQEKLNAFVPKIRGELGLSSENPHNLLPKEMSLKAFIVAAKKEKAFVFLGLHGGIGEDGRLQTHLESAGVPFNGSGAMASQICMDKAKTGQIINALNDKWVRALPKISISIKELPNPQDIWKEAIDSWGCKELIIKPQAEGCSAGVILLESGDALQKYLDIVRARDESIPAHTFKGQETIIEMPQKPIDEYMLEPFIEVDNLFLKDNQIQHQPNQGWIELTAGVLEQGGEYRALMPSIAIAENRILTVEEKFQGGTGINLTPPPEWLMSRKHVGQVQSLVEKVAQALGIENYARIDLFYNINTHELIVIEANSLPALTPSTVIYHQARENGMRPAAFLRHLVETAHPQFFSKT